MSLLIDASERFAQRRQVNDGFHADLNFREINEAAVLAVDRFIDEVYREHPNIPDYLPDSDRVGVKIVEEQDDVLKHAPILDVNRVHTVGGEKDPILHLTPSFLSTVQAQLLPYIEQMDSGIETANSTSIMVAARIGISSWIYDSLDPRNIHSEDEGALVRATLEAAFQGVIQQSEAVDSTLDLLRYQYMGYSALAPLLYDHKCATVQQVYQALFDKEDKKNAGQDPTFALRFIFAHPLSHQESNFTIEQLIRVNEIVDKYK